MIALAAFSLFTIAASSPHNPKSTILEASESKILISLKILHASVEPYKVIPGGIMSISAHIHDTDGLTSVQADMGGAE